MSSAFGQLFVMMMVTSGTLGSVKYCVDFPLFLRSLILFLCHSLGSDDMESELV